MKKFAKALALSAVLAAAAGATVPAQAWWGGGPWGGGPWVATVVGTTCGTAQAGAI